MPASIQILRILTATVLVAGAVALDQRASRAATGPAPAQDTVVIRRGDLQLVDPATGEVRWRVENRSGVSGVVTAPEGVVFASVATADGSGTDLYAIPPGSATPERIARVPVRAIVEGLGPNGDRLHLVEFANVSAEGILEVATGVREVLLPERWRGSAPPPAARRSDAAAGVLSPDARHWYRMQSTRPEGPDELPKPELLVLTFAEGGPPAERRIPIPGAEGFTSLLLAPDGSRLYVVDFFSQTVFVVEPEQGTVDEAVSFGQYRTKRSSCAAALSPEGAVLYVLGNGWANAGDGVFAFETTSWRPVGHFLPGQSLYCLAVSPDGNRLFASTGGSLVTIDVGTGNAEASIPLNIGDCCAFVIAAATPRSETH